MIKENTMTTTRQTTEEASKDRFFQEIAELAERMIAAHGRDFSMGALVLAARFIAENKPFQTKVAQ
jgi:hypothetical protein